MADKVVPIDSKYRSKKFPNGYFAAIAKQARGGGIIIIICGLIFALMGLGVFALLFDMLATGAFKLSGDDVIGIIIMAVIGLVFLIPGFLFIRMGVRRRKMDEDAWVKKFMDVSDYPESIIRDFGNQVPQEGSMRLQLGTSAIQGVLTRDYICICNLMAPCVMKIEDIIGAYMVEMSNQININGKYKTVWDTYIVLFSNHKTQMVQDAKKSTIQQIVELLKAKNPAIDTADGRILPETEYKQMVDAILNQ